MKKLFFLKSIKYVMDKKRVVVTTKYSGIDEYPKREHTLTKGVFTIKKREDGETSMGI